MAEMRYPRIFGCPVIEEDEALSGWVLAVANAARQPIRELFKIWHCQERDPYQIDVSCYVRPFAAMSSMTMVPAASIVAATRIFGPALSNPVYSCLTRRADGNPVHRYCPSCLTEDSRPYVRALWRLSYWTVCERHISLLLDRCPKCQSLLGRPPNREVMSNLSGVPFGAACLQCGHDLRVAPRVTPPDSVLAPLLQAQRRLHRLAVNPVQRLSLGTISSCLVFEALLLRENDVANESVVFVGLDWRRLLANRFDEVQGYFVGCELSDFRRGVGPAGGRDFIASISGI